LLQNARPLSGGASPVPWRDGSVERAKASVGNVGWEDENVGWEEVSVGWEEVSVGWEEVSVGWEEVGVGWEEVSVGWEEENQVNAKRDAQRKVVYVAIMLPNRH
jgi:hypothetical protein